MTVRRGIGGRASAMGAVAFAVLVLVPPACTTGARAPAASSTEKATPVGPRAESERLVPPGFGSLRQDEISMEIRAGPLQLKVTPLEEWVIRLTAPDTYQRLASLARAHRPLARRRTGDADPTLMLVSAFSEEQGADLDPEDLQLENRGRQYRPVLIEPVTAGWGTQRLTQRRPETAIYVFSGEVDLGLDLVVEYGGRRNHDWRSILRILESELPRARARAGGG